MNLFRSTTTIVTDSNRAPLPCVFLLIPLVLSCFALSPSAQSVTPAPDGNYGAGNTAEGANALLSRTTGAFDTAIGAAALLSDTTGSANTAIGAGALSHNKASNNTAVGANALVNNTAGFQNVAVGEGALFKNTASNQNTAVGYEALFFNGTGQNTAVGYQALFRNLSGLENTAMGDQALYHNTGGFFNVAVGGAALIGNVTGQDNTALGGGALAGSTGNDNTAIGFQAGINASTGSDNIYIGSMMGGVAGDSDACYIASIFGQTSANGLPVSINSLNKLGTTTSSKRFKDDIKPMDKASEIIFALKPVTFRYKKNLDPEGTPQFGLVAEDVQNVNPALVVRDKEGKPYSVRYDQVNAMLLNEFLKEYHQVQDLKAIVAEQQKQIEALGAGLQKVSDQLETSRPAPQTVASNQ